MNNWFKKISQNNDYVPPFEITSYNATYGELSGYFRRNNSLKSIPEEPYTFYGISPYLARELYKDLKSPYTAGRAIRKLHALSEQANERQEYINQQQEEDLRLEDVNQQMDEEDAMEQINQEKMREGEILE